jgi:hypothetical protein
MKKSCILSLLITLTVLALSTNAFAYTNSFDTAASTNGWVHWWGGARESVRFDPGLDANGDPASGSLQITVPFSRSLGGDNQFSMWGSFSGTPNSWSAELDGTKYASLEMDIYWDPFSPTIPSSGNFSSDFHYGFAVGEPAYAQIDFQNHLTIASTESAQWLHLSMPIEPTTLGPNLTNIVGIWFKMWTGNDPNNSLNDGDVIFWVDNIRLQLLPPPPPPTPDYTNTFDVVESLSGWAHWWGGAAETREWDPTVDADGNPGSGSMKVTVPYNRALGGDNQFSMWGAFSGSAGSWNAPLDGTLYTNLSMDVYWSPTSPTRPATGDYGNDFRYGFAVGAPIYGQIAFNNHSTIAAADVGHWFHLSAPIDLAAVGANITNIVGVWLKMWTGSDPNNSLNDGNAVFWVDNIRLSAKATNAPAIPPPTMAVEKARPGLRLFASAPGAQYQRQGVRTLNSTYSWVGALDPVTYSVTISDHPGAASFQTHIFLVPGSPDQSDNAPDYSQPHVVFMDIQANASGAFANFRYKTNEPNGNGFLYTAGKGTIAGVGSSTVLGTWSMTFHPDSTITMASPSGATTNFMMPAEAVGLFAGSLHAYFGIQPNQPANIGLAATIARAQISGFGAESIDDTFTTPALDTTRWQLVAADAAGVVPVGEEALFWLTWTVPDVGYRLRSSATLSGSSAWEELALVAPQLGNRKRTVVYPGNLPNGTSGNYFFELRRPAQ